MTCGAVKVADVQRDWLGCTLRVARFVCVGEARAALVDVWRSLVADNSKWVVSSALTSLGPFLALLTPDSITDGAPFSRKDHI